MKKTLILLSILLLALVVTACDGDPAPTPAPDDTVAVDADDFDEMNSTPATSGDTQPPADGEAVITGVAPVNTVDVAVMESFPLQAQAIVSGDLPDGCTELAGSTQRLDGTTISVTLTTSRPAEAECTLALVPFETVVPLDILGLYAGTYTVEVNGVTASTPIEITVDNFPLGDGSAAPGENCPVSEGDQISYINQSDGYCLLYPASFVLADREAEGVTTFSAASDTPDPDLRVALQVIVTPAEGRTLDAIQAQQEEQYGSLSIEWAAITIDGQPALVSETLPGRFSNRQAFIVVNDRIYNLIVSPYDELLPDLLESGDTIWNSAINSLTFFPPES